MNWLLNPLAGLKLRSLDKRDVNAIVALAGRSFNSQHVASQVQEELNAYVKTGADQIPLREQKDTFLWVSYYVLVLSRPSEEEILGITGLYHPVWAGDGVYWLGWYGTDARFHGHGYGIVLLKASMELARAQGGRLLCVETSRELGSAVSLYRKMGFCERGNVPDYWAPGENLIIMARNLDDIEVPKGVDWNG